MAEQMYIKQMCDDGVSKSEIQLRTKLNCRTVCKYADKEDWNEEKQLNLASESYPVLGKFIPLVNKWLEEDIMPRKQCHTANICKDVRKEMRLRNRVYVRQIGVLISNIMIGGKTK